MNQSMKILLKQVDTIVAEDKMVRAREINRLGILATNFLEKGSILQFTKRTDSGGQHPAKDHEISVSEEVPDVCESDESVVEVLEEPVESPSAESSAAAGSPPQNVSVEQKIEFGCGRKRAVIDLSDSSGDEGQTEVKKARERGQMTLDVVWKRK